MKDSTIAHVYARDKSLLHVETTTRALRHSVWLSVFLSQELQLHGLTHALTRVLVDIDRMLEEIELQP